MEREKLRNVATFRFLTSGNCTGRNSPPVVIQPQLRYRTWFYYLKLACLSVPIELYNIPVLRIQDPGSYFQERNRSSIIWVKHFFADPGSGAVLTLHPRWKNYDPESGIGTHPGSATLHFRPLNLLWSGYCVPVKSNLITAVEALRYFWNFLWTQEKTHCICFLGVFLQL